MLSAQAYSFRLKSRLAISLGWVAGYTNVIVLMIFGQTTSHMTGNSTHFGNAIGDTILRRPGAIDDVLLYAGLILLFLLGALVSGFMTEGARRSGRSSKYSLPISLEAILLSLLMLLLAGHSSAVPHRLTMAIACGLASFAMGLQNATITRISGAVVRTTHLTGVITDLGLELVLLWHWYRERSASRSADRQRRIRFVTRRQPNALRAVLLASILGSFLFGVTAGTLVFQKAGPIALSAPILFLGFIVLRDFFKPIADVREIDPTLDHDLGELGANLKSILPEHVGVFRLAHHQRNRRHHAPDFASWVDRIPHRWRVVILVISPLTQFNADAAAGLLNAAKSLRGHHRHLVISGMNRVQFKSLIDCGMSRVIDLDDFVPDLELAIARAINLTDWADAQIV
jgi:uncharacterized membrane protein YoaK (UPF0700 family)/anti-anti-sigma regulatory factor